MPDSFAGTYMTIGGEEIVNDQRTVEYIQAFGLPLTISEGCFCMRIQELAGCDDPATGYSIPSLDDAPWYDPAIPESGDFAGFLTAEFEGLGSTFTRDTNAKISGGSVLGRLRAEERVLTWRGFLFGRNCCATQYGLAWLTSRLGSVNCDDCRGEDVCILYCCPNVGGIPCPDNIPSEGIVQNDDAFRTLKRAGLLEGPTIVSQRRIGCGPSCEGACLIEVEFSLVAGNPYLHRDPEELCVVTFPEETPCPTGSQEWIKVGPGEVCPPEECPTGADCREEDTNCPAPPLPVIPPFVDPCDCDPLDPVSVCCEIDNSTFGTFFEGVPVIELVSGDAPLRAVTITFYENPQERDCSEIDDECFACDSLRVRFVPADSRLTIDGTTREIYLDCPGGVRFPGETMTVSPFKWPTMRCISYCICIEAEAIGISDNALVRISVVQREM